MKEGRRDGMRSRREQWTTEIMKEKLNIGEHREKITKGRKEEKGMIR